MLQHFTCFMWNSLRHEICTGSHAGRGRSRITSGRGQEMVAQTLDGAARLLLSDENSHPAVEIEKVTTPGGITIKGVNSLEHDGFTSAVINAFKASM